MGGQNNHRGGPRGGVHQGPAFRGRGRARGRGRGSGMGGYHTLDEMTEMGSMFFETSNRATASPRGRGFGRGSLSGSNTPDRGRGRARGSDGGGYQSSPGRGYQSSPGRDRGRGNGRGGSKLRPNAPLSRLLYEERPYLRPVIFVQAKTLFQEEEEILQPVVEEVGEGEQSHVPTAERVFRVFSDGNNASPFTSTLENEQDGSQGLEEIDFNDMERLLDLPDIPGSQLNADLTAVEEKFTGFYIDTNGHTRLGSDTIPMGDAAIRTVDVPTQNSNVDQEPAIDLTIPPTPMIQDQDTEVLPDSSDLDDTKTPIVPMPTTEIPQEELTTFYIDTEPSATPIDSVQQTPATHLGMPMGCRQIEDDEEIIVYVAPHPRSGRTSLAPMPDSTVPILPSTSVLTGTTRTLTSLASATTPPPVPASSTTSSMPASGSTTLGIDDLSISTNTLTLSSPTQAPTPSSSTRVPSPPPFSSVSFSPVPSTPTQCQRQRKYDSPVSTVRSRVKSQTKLRVQEARAARKRIERQQQQKSLFGSFGAIMEETQLRRDRDPRWEERRRGDSDVEWGDEDGDGGAVHSDGKGKGKGKGKDEYGSGMAEGMDLDPELELDSGAMRNFVRSMGTDGQNFQTMDDIADGEMMRREDEEDEDGGSSHEEDQSDEEEMNAAVHAEEQLLIAEGTVWVSDGMEEESDDDDDDDDDDESQSPRSGFQSRLERLRNHSRGKRQKDARDTSLGGEDDDDDLFERSFSWAEEDEDFIAHIQSILDENEAVLTGRDRKAKHKIFRAVHNGAFEDMEEFHPARKSKDKYKDIPEHLRVLWQKDRDQKAENKRRRALARLALASDPLSQKQGGKKGRKAMLAAAKFDSTMTVLPNRIIDMTTLVQQIRRFLANVGGPSTMSLPPTNKETRKRVHEIAMAFGLKSQSKGKGDARYTSLIKTSRSGVDVDERKVAKILRVARGGGAGGDFPGSGVRNNGRTTAPKHKEGDEVGKAAPKIGESNIGFRMLASMGWSEGERIGLTGGLDAPLTAVIKHTKLGLGATK